MAFTKVTVKVAVTPVGSIAPPALVTLVAAVPLDQSLLQITKATLFSDATALNGHNQAERTIVLNLTPAFKALFPDASDQRAPFWGYMRDAIAMACITPALASAPVLS